MTPTRAWPRVRLSPSPVVSFMPCMGSHNLPLAGGPEIGSKNVKKGSIFAQKMGPRGPRFRPILAKFPEIRPDLHIFAFLRIPEKAGKSRKVYTGLVDTRKSATSVPTGRVIKYPQKCTLFAPPEFPPDFRPNRAPAGPSGIVQIGVLAGPETARSGGRNEARNLAISPGIRSGVAYPWTGSRAPLRGIILSSDVHQHRDRVMHQR